MIKSLSFSKLRGNTSEGGWSLRFMYALATVKPVTGGEEELSIIKKRGPEYITNETI
jgi:hypothetical protein